MKSSYRVETAPPARQAGGAVYVAIRIADKYSHRLPKVQELMDDWGMNRATAYRWIRGIKDAKGLP